MVARQQRRRAKQNKLQFMRNLTSFKLDCYDPNSVIEDALADILKIQDAQTEYEYLKMVEREALYQMKSSNESEEVKVEKIGERFFLKVTSPKGGDKLVHILEALEEMGLNVFEAKVSCQDSFAMEAIVVPEEDQEEEWSVDDVTQSLAKALGKTKWIRE